ncbi:hypothetical protein DFH11DRAFT_1146447 [Phellopilus nigrolimitatus]|nr:hypothetical protein DFH11DRAFT_1146447 [Phellopilus nigrolimitatus]
MVVDDKAVLNLNIHLQSCAPVGPFVPRPFPPPALENVPLPYILDQLHNLAVHYWDKPQTADCTIIIPIDSPRRLTRNSTSCTANLPVTPPSATASLPKLYNDPAGLGRRVTEPATSVARVTRMTSKLHIDYLLAQSSLFRDLFSGRPPRDPLSPACPDSPNTPPILPRGVPQHRLPHILASPSAHPVIHLPLPDPSSFPHLVHFMYFGTLTVLEAALDSGQVRWADVVRNVEYLGMRTRVKSFLGRWYARHVGAGTGVAGGACIPPVVCGEDSDESCYPCGSDVDMDSDDDSSSSSEWDSEYDIDSDCDSDTDESLESLMEEPPAVDILMKKPDEQEKESMMIDEHEPSRGRSRTRISPNAPSFSPVRRRRV